MTIGIYTITNTINQKTYVGMSKNVEKRFIAHRYESMQHVVEVNPDFYPPAIYNVCNGYKKSYKGFLWVKQSKI